MDAAAQQVGPARIEFRPRTLEDPAPELSLVGRLRLRRRLLRLTLGPVLCVVVHVHMGGISFKRT